jgi:multiple antibiotic resistance protein
MENGMLTWSEYSSFAISLFAILTPFAAVPAFLSLTEGLTSVERLRTATTAASTAAIVLVVAALLGQMILTVLGASLGSLRVGGGLVLLLTALSMLNPRDDRRRPGSKQSPSAGIVPLGLPLLAGPGAISAVIVEMHHGEGVEHAAVVVLCVVSSCVAVWMILRLAQPIGERIGQSGLNALSRLFGLLLAAIAIKIIAVGLRSLFPALG